jgi:hypothetical protein
VRTGTLGGFGAAALVAVVLLAGGLVGRGAPPDGPVARPDAAASIARRGVELVLDTAPTRPGAYSPAVPVLDGLGDVATRLVRVLTGTAVLLRQCALDGHDRPVACAPAVAADPPGWEEEVDALVELVASFRGGDGRTVDCRRERCALQVVDGGGGGAAPLAGAELVFGRAAPAGAIAVLDVHADGVGPGERVSVEVTGFAPGEALTLGWCAPPGPVDRDACGSPAPTVLVVAGQDGRARAALEVPAVATGPGAHRCGVRRPCVVAVIDVPRSATVAVAAVTFRGPPGPDVPASRVVAGLGLAAVLAGAALGLRSRRDRAAAEVDPFEGVDLAVPEWDAISLDDEGSDDDLAAATS